MKNRLSAKALALLWLATVLLLAVVAWQKQPTVDTSMMSLLPPSQQQPIVHEASMQMGKRFSQRLLVLVSGEQKETARAAVKTLATRFESLAAVGTVIWKVDTAQAAQAQQALQPYRYVLLADQLKSKLQSGDTTFVRQQALSQIINPVSVGKIDLVSDPFALSSKRQLDLLSDQVNVAFEDGLLRLRDTEKTDYLVLVEFEHDAFQRQTQQAVLGELAQLQQAFKADEVTLTPSGLLVHADAGAKQAQREMSTIGVGSLIGIVLLMLWVFKSARQVGLLLLPIVVGCLVATAAAFLVFEKVHIVTFSFGAGLIGVAIDYALHFLCERRYQHKALSRILAGLTLGLFSSVLAYAAQSITPFPGLRQMAVFSVFGLIAAWLTVVLWLPLLTRRDALQPIPFAGRISQFIQQMPSVDNTRWLGVALTVLVLLSVVVIAFGKTEDDIRLLQTSPPTLIAQETAMQRALQLKSSTQFLLISCQTLQACLEQEEQLKPTLNAWVADNTLSDYHLLSDRFPSLAAQENNAQLVSTLYETELATLFGAVGLPDGLLVKAQAQLKDDISKRLIFEQLPSAMLAQSLSDHIVDTKHGEIATIVGLNTKTPEALQQKVNALDQQTLHVILVDQVASISNLMENYRQQVMLWVLLAYVFVFSVLGWRYKKQAVRIIMPPLVASLMTVAVLMQLSPGINLFHMVALILVLGIGVDMGIFLTETEQAENTWLAVTLSVVTSLLAFGLLSASQTPVLKHFGMTVLIGLTFVWVLSVLLRPDVKSTLTK